MGRTWILRLGHRPSRDKRVTTHVALTARAMGADGIVISTPDRGIEENVRSVNERFGGDFEVRTGVEWRSYLKSFEGTVVHLTMYGIPVDDAVERIPDGDVLVVVGAEKVPAEVYQRADLNVSVGSQPHSEIAALAILLDRMTKGSWKDLDLGGRMRIVPNERGKTVVEVPDRG